MSLPTDLPGCGAPATTVLEIFTRTGTVYSLDGRLNVCDQHSAPAVEALRAAGFEPHDAHQPAARCGDGYDYDANRPLVAPDVPSTVKHGFAYTSKGINGCSVACQCGFVTALHRKEADAADEWRAHAGLPPVRPDLHPLWCDELYADTACEVHMTGVGIIELAEDVHLTALLDDSGPDRGLVVTVSVLTRTAEVNHRIAIEPAPKSGKRTRKQHAFTVERTRGDHHVWTCSCGDWTRAHDPGDDITPDLIDHATGGNR